MANKLVTPYKIFYSYTHQDESLQKELEKHLIILKRQGFITTWHSREIRAGEEWQDECSAHLEEAHLILLLVSPDFMASDYCYDVEMQQALRKQTEGRAFVIPIILRPVDWEHSPISHLQVLPRGGKPITGWQGRYGRDKAFLDVVSGLRDIIFTANEIRIGKVETVWAVSDNPSNPSVDYAATLKQHMTFLDHKRKTENETGVTTLLERIAPSFVNSTQVAVQTGLNITHPNFAKTPLLKRGRLNSVRELVQEGLFPQRVFLQYINPEILSLYGINRKLKRQDLYKHALRLTKYALLLSEDILIMPASYLFEIGFIDQFLKELKPLQNAGVIQFSSQTADLYEYVHKKRVEYRDELVLFPDYAKEDRVLMSKRQSLSWIPRIQRSASKDIGTAWRQNLYDDKGMWRRILEQPTQKQNLLPSKLESAIEQVPDRLEDRAFIFRYTKPLLPMTLGPLEETQINMLLCRAYLESYLEEFSAMILVDTPIGRLDCGLPQFNINGCLRTISFRTLSVCLKIVNLSDYIDSLLSWHELVELREQPAFRWLMDLVVINTLDPSHPLETAILKSRYQPPTIPINSSGSRQTFHAINERIFQLLETMEPFLYG